MDEKQKEWLDKPVADIRNTGLSIAENAENIANHYKYLTDEIKVVATFGDHECPKVTVRQIFIPEYVFDKKEIGKSK